MEWSSNHPDVVKLLLDHGAKTTVIGLGDYHDDPLYKACYNRHVEVAKVLIDYGATILPETFKATLSNKGYPINKELVKLILDNVELTKGMKVTLAHYYKNNKTNESIGDFLQPKKEEEIQKALKGLFRPKDLRMVLDAAPNLQDYLKDFYLEKRLWSIDPKHPEYKTFEVINQGGNYEYPTLDVTDAAKKIILDCAKNFNFSPDKLKVIQTNAGMSKQNSLLYFMYQLNGMRVSTKHSSNDVLEYRYCGDYAFFGNSNGFAIFIIPPDFINKIYGLRESITGVLKPKTTDEITSSVKELLGNLEESTNAAEFIEGLKSQEYDKDDEVKIIIKELTKLAELMKSDLSDLEFLSEEENGYEEILNVLRMIDIETKKKYDLAIKQKRPQPSVFKIYRTPTMDYRINLVSKTTIGSNIDYNGLNAIFFNYSNLMKILNEPDIIWEKLPT
jgi:hypothetical protein